MWNPPSCADPTSHSQSRCRCPEISFCLKLGFENPNSPVHIHHWWSSVPHAVGTTSCTWCGTSNSVSWEPLLPGTAPSFPPCSRKWRTASLCLAAGRSLSYRFQAEVPKTNSQNLWILLYLPGGSRVECGRGCAAGMASAVLSLTGGEGDGLPPQA